jgi:hypothetical protein
MKLIVVFTTTFLFLACAKKKITSVNTSVVKEDTVIFITTIDTATLTKDGIYLNGYVVNVGYEEVKKLHNKRVSITGLVTIVKAVNNKPGGEMSQGREADTKHILKPTIKVLD